MKNLKHTDLIKNFNLIRYFIIGLSSICIVLILCFTYAYIDLYKYNFNHALKINSDGEVTQIQTVHMDKVFKAEAKHHIRSFINLFFEFDQYTYKERIEEALWLGDNSVKESYEKIKNIDDWYNKVVQNSVIQHVKWDKPDEQIKIKEGETDSWPFRVETQIQVHLAPHRKDYTLVAQGRLIKVKRNFPRNPHGLLITNFSYTLQKRENNEKDENQY